MVQCGLGDGLTDLTAKRRAHIIDVGQMHSMGGDAEGHAQSRLANMLGYSTALRSTTQVHESFSMQFLTVVLLPIEE